MSGNNVSISLPENMSSRKVSLHLKEDSSTYSQLSPISSGPSQQRSSTSIFTSKIKRKR